MRVRIIFRRIRIFTLFLILILVAIAFYLDHVGLPGFVKKPLLEKLRTYGIELQFTRLRLRWHRGLVAENVRFGQTVNAMKPEMTAKEVEVGLNYGALKWLHLQPDSLTLRQGNFSLPLVETNRPQRILKVENIETTIRLLSDDLWQLENFQAEFAGAKIQLSGAITNGYALRGWKIFQPRKSDKPFPVQKLLSEIADTLEQIHFSSPPHLRVHISGDALEPESFSARLTLNVSDAVTPWASVTNGAVSLKLFPTTNNFGAHAELVLTAGTAETRWGKGKNVQFDARIDSIHTNAFDRTDESLAWWTNLAPYSASWKIRAEDLQSPKLEAAEISTAGEWRAPELDITGLHARLYDGTIQASTKLDVTTRQFSFNCDSDMDIQKISPLLTEAGRRWLSDYSWKNPPVVKLEGSVILPAWTNRQADWRADVQPTIFLQGQFHVGNGAFRGIPAQSADSHFSYSNKCWRLPDLAVTRPEGLADLTYFANERTKDYHWGIHSTLDLRAFRPLLGTNEQREFDTVVFTVPPVIDGEIWGRWRDIERTAFKGKVALTNFTFRGQSADGLQTAVEYTNRFLFLTDSHIQRGTQEISAVSVKVDFDGKKVYVTNGFSTAEPMVVARAIGPKIALAIEPYKFLQPPVVRVEGIIPTRNDTEADLHFDVAGGPFEWLKFKVSRVSGKLDWVGERLTLNDVKADFYQGSATGWAGFAFHRGQKTDFYFDANVEDADFNSLMADLSARTNVQGKLTARLTITSANTKDFGSWQGQGRVNLRDGLIWDIPIFGIISPMLDGITPGLGSSRAREGSATFVITNGVIQSDDLEIRASVMRLDYRGTLDFRGRVDARVDAELFRDTWVIGRLLSTVLWPVAKFFEYRITGDIHHPKSEPVFLIPKLFEIPLHPIRTFKGMMPEEEPPPVFSEPPPVTPFPPPPPQN